MKKYTIEEIKEKAIPIAKRYGVGKLALFGSYARGESRDGSDIDFVIELGEISGWDFFGFGQDLEDEFEVKVDVLAYSTVPKSKYWCFEEVVLYDARDGIFHGENDTQLHNTYGERMGFVKSREAFVLEKIINYSERISATIERFELDYEKFASDFVVRDAISMCLLQIGELANKLSHDFRKSHSEVEWQKIISVRNKAAHGYEEMALETVWKIAIESVPGLKIHCEKLLEEIVAEG